MSAQTIDSNLPLTEQITLLERKFGIANGGATSVVGAALRVENIERFVLGVPQDGSLIDRVKRLEGVNRAQTQINSSFANQKSFSPPPPSAPVLSGGTDTLIAQAIALLPENNASSVTFARVDSMDQNPAFVGDYYDYVYKASKGKVMRFKSMPIHIFITPYEDQNFMRACLRSFSVWEEGTHSEVRFVQVESPSKARIRVVWSHLGVDSRPNSCSLGAHTITKWQSNPGSPFSAMTIGGLPISLPSGSPSYKVAPQLIEVNLDLLYAKAPEIRAKLLENIVAHELGHAMGLQGHSPVRSDLMSPVTDECSRLSQRDLNTLLKLYRSPVDIAL